MKWRFYWSSRISKIKIHNKDTARVPSKVQPVLFQIQNSQINFHEILKDYYSSAISKIKIITKTHHQIRFNFITIPRFLKFSYNFSNVYWSDPRKNNQTPASRGDGKAAGRMTKHASRPLNLWGFLVKPSCSLFFNKVIVRFTRVSLVQFLVGT